MRTALHKEKITATEQGEGALKKGEVAPSQRGHEKSWDEIMEYQKVPRDLFQLSLSPLM